MASPYVDLQVGERVVRVTNPDRVYFSALGRTKIDVANYYVAVGEGIVRALYERPCMLHRYPTGTDGDKVYQNPASTSPRCPRSRELLRARVRAGALATATRPAPTATRSTRSGCPRARPSGWRRSR